MRATQVASEALLGLRRNLVMTLAAIITVSVSLAFVGAALLVRDTVDQMEEDFFSQFEIAVFLEEAVTDTERTQVQQVLEDIPVVQEVLYESKEEAFAAFQRQNASDPDLIASVTADVLPESYRVRLADPEEYEVVASAVTDLPGVDTVFDSREVLDTVFDIFDQLRNVAVIVALVQLVAAILLIGNTVRVTAFSRRRETSVMRLVGASRLSIQLPFLIEGVLAGLIGAVLSIGVLLLGREFIIERGLSSVVGVGVIPPIEVADVLAKSPVLLLIGVVVSGLAALVTLQRYIRV